MRTNHGEKIWAISRARAAKFALLAEGARSRQCLSTKWTAEGARSHQCLSTELPQEE